MQRSYFQWSVAVPYWFPAMAFVLLSAGLKWRRSKAASRRQQGQCLRCGYDRRYSPNRCPECGSP